MEREKIRQESAFPTKPTQVVIGKESYTYQDENGRDRTGYRSMFGEVQNNGMSKRFYAACVAMQGILSCRDMQIAIFLDSGNKNLNPDNLKSDKYLIKVAYEYADELLKQEQ